MKVFVILKGNCFQAEDADGGMALLIARDKAREVLKFPELAFTFRPSDGTIYHNMADGTSHVPCGVLYRKGY